MKRFCFLTLILISTLSNLYGQENGLRPYSRGQLTTNIGYRHVNANLSRGFITDPLIKSNYNASYWQLISFEYFFFPHWGLQYTVGPMPNSHPGTTNTSGMEKDIEEIYGSDYFIEFQTFGDYSDGPEMYLGVVYRFQNNQLQGQVKGLLRYMDLGLSGAGANLKEKGSHHILELTYTHKVERNLSLGPSVTLGYRIYKIFMVNVNLHYNYTSVEFNYTETLNNPFTDQSTTKVFNYNASLHTFSAEIGLTVEFGSFGNKR